MKTDKLCVFYFGGALPEVSFGGAAWRRYKNPSIPSMQRVSRLMRGENIFDPVKTSGVNLRVDMELGRSFAHITSWRTK